MRHTGGETGHKDVEVGGDGDVFVLELVMHLHHVVIDDGHVTNIHRISIQELMKALRIIKGFDLGLVKTLSKLAPHGIEHHFG